MDREDDIKVRAHQIWEEEGRPDGQHEAHWRRAEEELSVPTASGEVGGMLGGQSSGAAPSVNAGSVSGNADETTTAKPKKG